MADGEDTEVCFQYQKCLRLWNQILDSNNNSTRDVVLIFRALLRSCIHKRGMIILLLRLNELLVQDGRVEAHLLICSFEGRVNAFEAPSMNSTQDAETLSQHVLRRQCRRPHLGHSVTQGPSLSQPGWDHHVPMLSQQPSRDQLHFRNKISSRFSPLLQAVRSESRGGEFLIMEAGRERTRLKQATMFTDPPRAQSVIP